MVEENVFGLSSVQLFFVAVLSIAMLGFIIVVISGTLSDSTIIPQQSLSSSDIILVESTSTLSPVGIGITSSEVKANNLTWLEFDGVNDKIEIPDDGSLSGNYTKYSISFWMNVSGSGLDADDMIVSKFKSSGNSRSFYVRAMDSFPTRMSFLYGSDGSVTFNWQTTDGFIYNDSVFHFYTITFNSGEVRFYRDGIFNTTGGSSIESDRWIYESTEPISIGTYGNGGKFVNASIDNIKIYNDTLNPNEVTYQYLGGRNG